MLTESECFSGTNIPKSFIRRFFATFQNFSDTEIKKMIEKELDKMIESATKIVQQPVNVEELCSYIVALYETDRRQSTKLKEKYELKRATTLKRELRLKRAALKYEITPEEQIELQRELIKRKTTFKIAQAQGIASQSKSEEKEIQALENKVRIIKAKKRIQDEQKIDNALKIKNPEERKTVLKETIREIEQEEIEAIEREFALKMEVLQRVGKEALEKNPQNTDKIKKHLTRQKVVITQLKSRELNTTEENARIRREILKEKLEEIIKKETSLQEISKQEKNSLPPQQGNFTCQPPDLSKEWFAGFIAAREEIGKFFEGLNGFEEEPTSSVKATVPSQEEPTHEVVLKRPAPKDLNDMLPPKKKLKNKTSSWKNHIEQNGESFDLKK